MDNVVYTKRQYQIRFGSPAFLGNAEQSGQLRTPPFKALLRQYWRMAYSAQHQHNVNINDMRQAEAALFGTVEGDEGANKSSVRLRLSNWNHGKLSSLDSRDKVVHREVPQPVSAALYLGYGPLAYDRDSKSTKIKNGKALDISQTAQFSLAYPESADTQMLMALDLIALTGTLGGRSRNGWGSVMLLPSTDATPPLNKPARALFRHYSDCLKLDWPHALGADDAGPLMWRSAPQPDWQSAIKLLATVKIELRTQFQLDKDIVRKTHSQPQDRHVLAYPVTNHSVKTWGNNLRLPNFLRFKISDQFLHSKQNKIGYIAQIIHIPAAPTSAFTGLDPNRLKRVWTTVHASLDNNPELSRCQYE